MLFSNGIMFLPLLSQLGFELSRELSICYHLDTLMFRREVGCGMILSDLSITYVCVMHICIGIRPYKQTDNVAVSV